ncbi:MAG: L-serine ammonia-lyase, iron-sulfur-dependent, subunit alpha [Sedimentibacter sp.]|uniref:L-cysteine desulfidase family protein n=1 Tax=Sedimentibacter sp. TaxID=1960295 RepID=UPI002980B4CC|nr:L-serine ammonia-lyase, iron-sulfur-dependent, subunit alpha [Sedimentibacter sp.]MDW5300366.1 L-serine ammonia-lyase, iron-sulfur-dependent, subunit alpha [Sedimentibacter sp.]
MNNELIIEILKNQVTPALGCTEPGAVAYAVARAKELLDSDVKKLNIEVDKNILKNGMSVGIPGTDEHGNIFAAALSLVIGKSEYKLEVLKDVDKASIDKALKIVDADIINLKLNEDIQGLYIKVDAIGDDNKSEVIIKNTHTNIIYESKNDEVLLDSTSAASGETIDKETKEIKNEIKKYSIEDLLNFSHNVPLEEISFIQKGIDMNMLIANVGLSEKIGIGMGNYFHSIANDVFSMAKAYTAAASEARMSGYPLPVMSSAGSGNHGLVAIVPISYIGSKENKSNEKIIRAITLSHLVTIFVKAHLGALSPVCGCGVAAGVGCAAGLTYLFDGTSEQIMASINNMVAGISGMFCDGAKLGCSYKLSIAVDAAVDASKMALKNIFIPNDNGILGETPEKTIINLAQVSNMGMNNTDEAILNVMLNRC